MFAHVRFKKSHPKAHAPIRGTAGAAAYDLVAAETVREGSHIIVNTGLRTSFSHPFVMLIMGRSGYARKHGIHLANGVAVIDSDYRGDIQLIFRTDPEVTSQGNVMELLAPGNRVAQAMLLPLPMTSWEEVDELDSTVRGLGGFGSTGSL